VQSKDSLSKLYPFVNLSQNTNYSKVSTPVLYKQKKDALRKEANCLLGVDCN
jgi:hypothetical protein